MDEATERLAYGMMYAVTFVIGLYSSYRMWRRYMTARDGIARENRPVLHALVVTCFVITAAAGWLGFLSMRAIVGLPRMDWTPPFNVVIASAVLLLPGLINLRIRQVARSRGET